VRLHLPFAVCRELLSSFDTLSAEQRSLSEQLRGVALEKQPTLN
jgi:hypothetical protein